MNNKGFTLIELIATIALLAVIAVISFVSITGVIKKGKVSDCETLVNNIKSAASEYVSDNRYKLQNDYDLVITAEILVNGKYLSSPIINPWTGDSIKPKDIKMIIKLDGRDYSARNVIIEAPTILKDCKSGI